MKAFLNLFFGIVNLFFIPLVFLHTYEWFSPHVGFDLPTLTYWNIFALIILKGMFTSLRTHVYAYASFTILATEEKEKDTVKEWVFTIGYLAVWGCNWLYHVCFF